jgi:RecB family endonuclease NucS
MKSDFNGVILRRIAGGWEFSSELALENFIWDSLEELLGLSPLKRQYFIRGEVCDILAVTTQRQLVILELKNAEDRYIVQQLTRYYDSLIEEKPFPQDVDYAQPVRLIAIAPTFHRHNYVDRKYNRLSIEFIKTAILQNLDEFSLRLEWLDNSITQLIRLPYQELNPNLELLNEPEIPGQLGQWLSSCPPQQQEGFRKIRSYILGYHERMQEFIDKKSIQYGTGKTKLCAEFCFDSRKQVPILFLWLPLPSSRKAIVTGRLRVWTDGVQVSDIGHVPEGLGHMRLEEEWKEIPKERWPRKSLLDNLSHKSHIPVSAQGYLRILTSSSESEALPNLEIFVELALQKWLEKL